MLTIRLTRKGKKNQPFFRIVVIDKRRSSKGGRAAEELGYVNPLTKKNSINKERVLYWLSVGAQASPRIHNLLVSEKIIEAPKINLYKKSKKVEAPIAPAAPTAEASTPVAEVPAPAPEVKVESAPVEAPVEKKEEVPVTPPASADSSGEAKETPVEPAK